MTMNVEEIKMTNVRHLCRIWCRLNYLPLCQIDRLGWARRGLPGKVMTARTRADSDIMSQVSLEVNTKHGYLLIQFRSFGINVMSGLSKYTSYPIGVLKSVILWWCLSKSNDRMKIQVVTKFALTSLPIFPFFLDLHSCVAWLDIQYSNVIKLTFFVCKMPTTLQKNACSYHTIVRRTKNKMLEKEEGISRINILDQNNDNTAINFKVSWSR